MSSYIKKCREEAGLTQAQLAEKMDVTIVSVQNWEGGKTKINQDKYLKLAEVFNVPVEKIIKEIIIEEGKKQRDNWPDFLFDDETNKIVDTLHLNLAQQDLFGLLYIYGSDYLNNTKIGLDTFDEDLKKVPYGFIKEVGSIRFMNIANDLHNVIKYVQSDFLLKVLKQNPETEFNVRKLSKDLICEFIDNGFKGIDETMEFEPDFESVESLDIKINMNKAKIILPLLNEFKEVHVTDGWWSNPIREDIPEKILAGIMQMCGFKEDLFKDGYYKDNYNISYIRNGLEKVTEYFNASQEGNDEMWMWKINDVGKKLINWLRD